MDIDYLLQILTNKIATLNTAKGQVFASGSLDQMNTIDKEILDTQNTINQLNMVASIARLAKETNSTPAEVIASGVDAIKNPDPIVQGPSASAVVNGYDISAYATDPLYEDKIRTILGRMPAFSIVGDIDAYIQGIAQGSPVTGDMCYKSAQQYGTDLSLMVAIMQNDSAFGTLGVGATTFNPGNVGNTGTSTQTFPSWQDGVAAVADWLNRHRVVVPTTNNQPVVDTTVASPSPVSVTTASQDMSYTSTNTTQTVPVPVVSTPEIISTTPIVATTTNATFFVPTANATTTPIIDTTNLSATTSPVILPDDFSSDATNTEPIIPTDTATSTPDDILNATTTPNSLLNATTTPVNEIIPEATTTSDTSNASTTAFRRVMARGKITSKSKSKKRTA